MPIFLDCNHWGPSDYLANGNRKECLQYRQFGLSIPANGDRLVGFLLKLGSPNEFPITWLRDGGEITPLNMRLTETGAIDLFGEFVHGNSWNDGVEKSITWKRAEGRIGIDIVWNANGAARYINFSDLALTRALNAKKPAARLRHAAGGK